MAIGNWDNTACKYLLAPICLKQGSNPAAFNTSAASFLYRGASAGGTEYATLTNMATGYGYTTSGDCLHDGTNDRVVFTNLSEAWNSTSTQSFFINMYITSLADGAYFYPYSSWLGGNDFMAIYIYRVGSTYTTRINMYRGGGLWGRGNGLFTSNPVGDWHTLGFTKDSSSVWRTYCDAVDITDSGGTNGCATIAFANNEVGGFSTFPPFIGKWRWAAFYSNVRSSDNITADHANAATFYGLKGYSTTPGTDEVFDTLEAPVSPSSQLLYSSSILRGVNRGFLRGII